MRLVCQLCPDGVTAGGIARQIAIRKFNICRTNVARTQITSVEYGDVAMFLPFPHDLMNRTTFVNGSVQEAQTTTMLFPR
jgi:hypothetical protein